MKTKKGITLHEFDAARYLKDEETIVEYFNLALSDGDPVYIKAALANIARARNMSQLADKAGLSRSGLYKALAEDSAPEYSTIQKVINALDLHLIAVSKNKSVFPSS